MRSLRNVLITVLITVALFSTVSYIACNKDRCHNVVCLNGGACDDGSCTCATGFEGDRCQQAIRDRFITTFNGVDSCSVVGSRTYYIRFLKAPNLNKTQMTMKGILGSEDDSALCSIQGLDSFIFNGNNNATTYRGYGIIRNDSLRLIYHVLADTTNYDCKFWGLRY